MQEWVVRNIPTVLTEGVVAPVVLPQFHIGQDDPGNVPLWMRVTLTPTPIADLFWDGDSSLADGRVDDHWIQWPHTQGTAMLPVLMRCPREVKFSGKETVSFDCTITGVNDAAMDVTYRLGRIDGATRINGEVVHVQQVRLGASSSPGLPPASKNPIVHTFVASRSGLASSSRTLPSRWTYRASLNQPRFWISHTGVVVAFQDSVGDILFTDDSQDEATGLSLHNVDRIDQGPVRRHTPSFVLGGDEMALFSLFDPVGALVDPGIPIRWQDEAHEADGDFENRVVQAFEVNDDERALLGLLAPIGPGVVPDIPVLLQDKAQDIDSGKKQKKGETELVISTPYTTPPTFPRVGLFAGETKCRVQRAILKYGKGQTVKAELQFPGWATPPKPGSPAGNKTGPIRGVVPKSYPDEQFAGVSLLANAFAYVSTLNDQHGCFSQQYKRAVTFTVRSDTHQFVSILPGKVTRVEKTDTGGEKTTQVTVKASALTKGYYHDAVTYGGNTHTGYSPKKPKKHYYQGTPSIIRWLDAPVIGFDITKPEPNTVVIRYGTLSSITWNSDGKGGWQCRSGHMMAFDAGTLKPMAPADANKLLASLKVPAAAKGEKKADYERLKNTLGKFAKNNLYTHNPLFVHLGCKAF